MRVATASFILLLAAIAAVGAPSPLVRLLIGSLGLLQALKLTAFVLGPARRSRGILGETLFWFFWPGVVPGQFVRADSEGQVNSRIFFAAWLRFIVGGIFILSLFSAVRPLRLPFESFSWMLLGGTLISLHLGLVTALPQIFRALGFSVPLTFNRPWAPLGLVDFWSRRWNLAFVDANRFFVLKYFSRAKYLAGFFASGLIHEIAISAVARGGWGKPSLYFGIQWVGVWLERRLNLGRLPRPLRCLLTAIFVLAPINLLFHPEFRHAVMFPLYEFLLRIEPGREFILRLCLTIAGTGTLLTIAAGSQVPARLGWKVELKRLRPFNEKIFRTYYGYIAGSIVFIGVVTLVGKTDILKGGFLAAAFLGYAFSFWFSRIIVDFFYFAHADWPKERIFFIGHVCLTTLFLVVAGGFGVPLSLILKELWLG